MLLQRWFTLGENPWSNGLRLAALNSLLAVFCIGSFLGTLGTVALLSTWLMSATGNPRSFIPFPYPLLLLLYVVIFITAWVLFAKRLPKSTRRQIFQTALIGATPLFGLSLLGYASVAWTLAFGDFNANQMLEVSVWIYGMISTLILLAGLSCVALITLIGLRGWWADSL